MKTRALILAALIALAAMPAAGFAQPSIDDKGDSLGAAWGPQQDRAREGVRRGTQVPLSLVVNAIARRVPGRMLDAGLENQGGRQVYRVRWLTDDGRRIDILVDAASGAILNQ